MLEFILGMGATVIVELCFYAVYHLMSKYKIINVEETEREI